MKSLLVLSLMVFGLLSFNLKIIKGDWRLDRSGNLVNTPQVLGEQDSQTDTNTPEVQKPEPSKAEPSNAPEPTKTEVNNDSKVILPTGNPVKEIKNENIEKLDIKVNENDKLNVDIETKDKKKIQTEQDSFKIEDINSDNEIKISTSESKGDFDIEKNKVKATVGFPLSINPTTKELTVTTPDGQKTVTILPDKAAAVIAGLNLLDNAATGAQIQMVNKDNKLVYQVDGSKSKKLLGLLPVEVKKMVTVSTQTGGVVSINEDLLNKILDLISF